MNRECAGGRSFTTNSCVEHYTKARPKNGRDQTLSSGDIGKLWKLFLKDHWGSADSLPLEIDGYLYPVSDLDEWNAAVHAVFLSVEGHDPVNRA